MSLDLNEDCKTNLKDKIAEALLQVKVINMSFLDKQSLSGVLGLEEILPSGKRVEFESFIGESPLFDFIYGYLSKELNEGQEWTSESESPEEYLRNISQYSNLDALSDRIVNELDSLPWEYCFTFKLKGLIARYVTDEITELSEDIKIIIPGEELTTKFPLQSGIPSLDSTRRRGRGLLRLTLPAEWDNDSLYVQIKANGFVGKYVSTTPQNIAVDKLKSLLGLLIALRCLKVKHPYSTSMIKGLGYIHRNKDGWNIEDSFELDDDVSKTISNLDIDDIDGILDTDAKKSFIKDKLNLLAKSLAQGDTSKKLSLAGQWLFDSYCGTNELLSFIQTTVSLEILLGDKNTSNLMGLSALLRNRCAYLIGKSHSERKEILDNFDKIYDIRSKIVHQGKSQLSRHDRELFFKLQCIANKVIEEEIELIGKNE